MSIYIYGFFCWCHYPHMSRDLVSPVCGICLFFIWIIRVVFSHPLRISVSKASWFGCEDDVRCQPGLWSWLSLDIGNVCWPLCMFPMCLSVWATRKWSWHHKILLGTRKFSITHRNCSSFQYLSAIQYQTQEFPFLRFLDIVNFFDSL